VLRVVLVLGVLGVQEVLRPSERRERRSLPTEMCVSKEGTLEESAFTAFCQWGGGGGGSERRG
jgi:hypothetical protein